MRAAVAADSGRRTAAHRLRWRRGRSLIAFVIRDRDWGTLALRTTSANLDSQADSFRYNYSAQADGAPVTVSITVAGQGDGQVSVEGEARVGGAFETNRTGFVILHPIEGVAGAAADVVGSDGSPRHGSFPERISPGQPFFDIQEPVSQ